MSAVTLVTGEHLEHHFYRGGLLVCTIHGWSCRWVEPRLLEIVLTLLYCDCSMPVRQLLMMFLCITNFIIFQRYCI